MFELEARRTTGPARCRGGCGARLKRLGARLKLQRVAIDGRQDGFACQQQRSENDFHVHNPPEMAPGQPDMTIMVKKVLTMLRRSLAFAGDLRQGSAGPARGRGDT